MNQIPVMPGSVSVLDSSFIRSHVTMARAIDLMEEAFRVLSSGEAAVPPRVVMNSPDNAMSLFFKPAFLSRYNRMSVKILTQILANENPEIPTIKGLVLLLDMVTGQILSMSDGNYITALRTGAASGIATRYLARPGSRSLAVFGCGAQGRTQLEAILAVRPIERVCLFDSLASRAEAVIRELPVPVSFQYEINPELSVLKEMDVICTATPSANPLFYLPHLKPGVHINAVGSYRPDMQEIGPDVLSRARTYLDDAPGCIDGSGDLMNPIAAGIISRNQVIGEIGELIAGKVDGRQHDSDITLFKSVGNAVQDFFVANEAYEKSLLQKDVPVFNLNG